MDLALTRTPVDIIAALSLDGSETYSIQADPQNYVLVHLDDGDDPPDVGRGRKLRPLDVARARAGTGGKLWVWAPAASESSPVHVNVYAEP